jgi:hypothetical protein
VVSWAYFAPRVAAEKRSGLGRSQTLSLVKMVIMVVLVVEVAPPPPLPPAPLHDPICQMARDLQVC